MRSFQQVLEAAGYVTRAHSGHGMSGRDCLSVTLAGDGMMGRFFADVLEAIDAEEMDPAAHAFRRMRTDSLGKGTVVYFPGVPFKE